MTKCDRYACSLPATHHVRIAFWSGRRLDADLCTRHAYRLHDGLLVQPQTRSGSCTPLVAAKVAA